jgi:hypothetical protein
LEAGSVSVRIGATSGPWADIDNTIKPARQDAAVLLGRALVLPSFTVAQLLANPPPPTRLGCQVWCSDHAGGPRIVYGDGSDWRDLRTGLVVS